MDRIVTVRFLVDVNGGGRNAPAASAGDVQDVTRGRAQFLLRRKKAELFSPVEEVKAKPEKKPVKKATTKKKAVKK